MDYVGMLALGAFIGTVVTVGLNHIKDWSNLKKVLTTIISAALAGAVMSFIRIVGGSTLGPAVTMYPVGLVVGLAWTYAGKGLDNTHSDHRSARIIGWLHLFGLVVMTLFVAAMLLSPGFRSLLPAEPTPPCPSVAPSTAP